MKLARLTRFLVAGVASVALVAPLPAQEKEAPKESAPAPEAPPPAPPGVEDIINEMPQAALQEAFRILRSDYIQRDTLTYLELNRSALQGLLARMEFGATLLTEEGVAEQDSPFAVHSQSLARDIGYFRFSRYTQEEIDKLDEALRSFNSDQTKHLILDLRSPQKQAEFGIAAEILGRFCPPNSLVFKIHRPNDNTPTLFTASDGGESWSRDLIVLADQETGNAGEVIAAVIRHFRGSLVVGEKTRGLTVEFRDVPIGEGRILRYAVAEVILPDGESLFRKGVEPDLVARTTMKSKHAVFKASEKQNLKNFLFDRQRPRMNEAALVAGTDPELDYFLARSSGRPTPFDQAPLQDRVLQQAVDLIYTANFLSLGPVDRSVEEEDAAEPGKDDAPAEAEADEKPE